MLIILYQKLFLKNVCIKVIIKNYNFAGDFLLFHKIWKKTNVWLDNKKL